MKKLWHVFLAVALLASLIVLATPASAQPSDWVKETIPSDAGNVILACDIVDLAVGVGGITMYAATGTTILYQSTNAGRSWKLRYLPGGATADLVAVAPDGPSIIVVLDDNNDRGFFSTNGGFTWSELYIPPGVYNDIAISAEGTDGVRYIGVVGASTGTNDPFFYYYNLGAATQEWVDAVTSTDWSGWSGAPYNEIDELKAVAFSPNFASDKVAVLVSEEKGSATGARFHMASLNNKSWDNAGGFFGYPVNLVSLSSSTVANVRSASISLAPDYLGSDDALRLAFIGLAITDVSSAEQGGIMRLNDIALDTLWPTTAIHSIAYNGTNLVAGATTDAGDVAHNRVYRSDNPMSESPTVNATNPFQSPGGETAVIVAWAGANVVAGTSGNESAFAISRNNGESFNDISLIDTTLTTLEDVAVSRDGSKIYLLSDDGTDLSLWRYDGSWERVITLLGESHYMVRIAPNNASVVYLSSRATTDMLYSNDSAETKWYFRACNIIPVDLAVESDFTLYAVNSSGYVSKSTNTGFTWGAPQDTTLGSQASITSISESNIIAGGANGYVAYSNDGNSSWTKISEPIIDIERMVYVTADGLATGNYIYAVSRVNNDYIYRWKIVPSTITWTKISPALGTDFMCYDIELSDGVLYALGYDTGTTVSTVYRTPKPHTGQVTWDTLATDAGVKFTNSPNALVINDQGESKIWAIDSYAGSYNLYSYRLN